MSWMTLYFAAAFITFVALVKSGLTRASGRTVPASVHWVVSAGFGCLGVMNIVQAVSQGSLARGALGLLLLLFSGLRALEAGSTRSTPPSDSSSDRPR